MYRQPHRIRLWVLVSSVAISLSGCGDDSEEPFELDGVYTVTEWTENTTTCDTEGPSVLDAQTETSFIVKRQHESFLGQSFTVIIAGPCLDPQSCANDAGAGAIGGLFTGLTPFDPGEREGEAWTTSTSVASRVDMECTGSMTTLYLRSPEAGVVQKESRTTESITFPATPDEDGDPSCDLDTLEELAATASCARFSVITANNPMEIPPAQE